MRDRFLTSMCALAALGLLTPAHLSSQTPAKTWTPPRTPDGQPDLQGIWTNATLTPFERPAFLGDKQFFTAEEAAEFAKLSLERANRDRRGTSAEADVNGAYNESWFDRGTSVSKTRRTSLVVDPPNGKIPPLTPQGLKIVADIRAYAALHPADGPEDRSLAERCLLTGAAGPPMIPGPYNNTYQIVQTPGYVIIVVEMIHDARIIPLDGRPHLPKDIHQWMGDPRGHWEGNTLVVDTTNFTDQARYRGSGEGIDQWRAITGLHLVERFTRVDTGTILYEFTVDDPATFTRPWKAEIPMSKAQGPVFEYACHEGNYAMESILGGARAADAVSH